MIYNQIGRYKIVRPLGRGAMGEVYCAYDPDLDREVALKLIAPPDPASGDEWRRRFRREVQAAARLNHPHIIAIYDVDLEHDPPYVVMELLTGGTLRDRLAVQKPLPWQEALDLLYPICQALAYAHRAGVVHRDVKPTNVMFARDETLPPGRIANGGTLKLVDFGLAHWEGGEQVTRTGDVVGTPAYMAPEQANGEAVDARVDIYSLGIMLLEAIAGHNPQDKGSMSQTWAAATSLEAVDLGVLAGKAPLPLVKVIGRALAKDRSQRYHDCDALGEDLARCRGRAAVASSAARSSSLQAGPHVENPKDLPLPPQAEDILEMMFAAHHRVVIGEEFGGGLSGSRVFMVRPIRDDGTPELPAVVKIAPIGLIQKEWRAFQDCMHDQWPSVVEVRGEPVLPPGCDWGGLRYPLAGAGAFEVESLGRYCRHATVEDICYALEKRLFQLIRQTWRFSRRTPAFNLRASYDSLLPVNLVIKPGQPPPGAALHVLRPGASTGQPPGRGDWVKVEGFVITEVEPLQQAVTLNLPPVADDCCVSYRLRLQLVETAEPYQVNNILDPITGTVVATRHDLLHAQAQQALGQAFDLEAESLVLADGVTLPNPLTALATTFGEQRDVIIASIHGDLNLENILVDRATRDISLIDFASARRDHTLHDLLRLETEVVTKLVPPALVEADLLPQTIHALYEQLHRAALLSAPDAFAPPHDALKKPLAMLAAIRRMAHDYLFNRDDWAEYYRGLTLYLLGALKFKNLDAVPEAPLPKQVAFWGAASVQYLLAAPAGPRPVAESLPLDESLLLPLEPSPAALDYPTGQKVSYPSPEQAAQVRRQLGVYAVSRLESAVIIAATIFLMTLAALDIGWLPGAWWLWLLAGLLAETAIVVSTMRDGKLYRQVLDRLFPHVTYLNQLQTPELQQKVAKALECRDLIVKQIKDEQIPVADGSTIERNLDDWMAQICRLAQRLDNYRHDAVIAQDMATVPRELAKLHKLLAANRGKRPAELEKAVVLKQAHRDSLAKLRDTMLRATLQLENSLSAIGAIYTQVRLLESEDANSSRHAQRLQADMAEQVQALTDLSTAMDEVYGTQGVTDANG